MTAKQTANCHGIYNQTIAAAICKEAQQPVLPQLLTWGNVTALLT